MRLGLLTLSVMMAVGCTAKEPEFPRLKTGDEALVYDRYNSQAPLRNLPKGRGLEISGENLGFLPVGTKVRAISDKGPDFKDRPGDRQVRVVPLEGEYDGVAGTMYRKNLKLIGQ